MGRPRGGKGADRLRRTRYAKLRGRGKSRGAAARGAGFTSKRALRGQTGYDLERDPKVIQIMRDEMNRSMTSDEVQNLLGAQARGELPTKVVKDGKTMRIEYDTLSAAEDAARIHQLFKDGAPPPPPVGPIQVEHRVAGLTDDELRGLIAQKLDVDPAALAAQTAGRAHA